MGDTEYINAKLPYSHRCRCKSRKGLAPCVDVLLLLVHTLVFIGIIGAHIADVFIELKLVSIELGAHTVHNIIQTPRYPTPNQSPQIEKFSITRATSQLQPYMFDCPCIDRGHKIQPPQQLQGDTHTTASHH